jgi:NAD(P)-dependent dehydrogenase (short-subunit alcohol dehydrogenase family)
MMILEGKSAVVTGSGRGVGRAEIIALAKEGAQVVINDVDEEPANEVLKEIEGFGGKAVICTESVGSMKGAEKIIQTAVDNFGKIDILVNNAGIGRDRMVFNMTEEEWDDVVNIHLKGTFACTKFASALMRKQNSGRIINTTSGAGLRGATGQSNYAAAKAGICGFTLSVAMELTKYSVTANVIIPAARTRITEKISDKAKKVREEGGLYKASASPIPEPETVAPLVVFLASDNAQDINGQIVAIRGDEISLWTHPNKQRFAYNAGGWTAELLMEKFRTTVANGINLAYSRGAM